MNMYVGEWNLFMVLTESSPDYGSNSLSGLLVINETCNLPSYH